MGFNCFKLIVTSEISYFSIKLKLMLESNNLICGLTPLCDFIIWQYSDHVIPYLDIGSPSSRH